MYDPSLHHRRSIRLKGFNYQTPGAYVVTICTHRWMPFLASIECRQAQLTAAGYLIQDTWDEIPANYPGIEIDAFVVMPNHVHGIIVLTENQTKLPEDERLSLPNIVERYKSLTTRRYIQGVRELGWPPFDGRLWHRNYFERVIRSESELSAFRQYIQDNPAAWDKDQHNPDRSR